LARQQHHYNIDLSPIYNPCPEHGRLCSQTKPVTNHIRRIPMRRIIIIGTAVAVLVSAGAAYAALNNYTAGFTFSPSKGGSAKSPVPVAFAETLTAANAIATSRAAPLVDIKWSVYGLVSNPKPFPTCTDVTRMSVQKTDSFCPPKALVASGPVNSLLGGPKLSVPGGPCNPFLHVWNAGGGKVWFFFTTSARYSCGSLHTGDTQAYAGYLSRHGKYLVLDNPLPSFISTAVAHHKGLYGSLIKEVLTYRKLTAKVKGKTVGFTSSVGCKGGKRPFSVSFTAVSGATKETKVVPGSAKC
jgi:hypothetical protein